MIEMVKNTPPQLVDGKWQVLWGTRIIKKKFETQIAAIAYQVALESGLVIAEYEPLEQRPARSGGSENATEKTKTTASA